MSASSQYCRGDEAAPCVFVCDAVYAAAWNATRLPHGEWEGSVRSASLVGPCMDRKEVKGVEVVVRVVTVGGLVDRSPHKCKDIVATSHQPPA